MYSKCNLTALPVDLKPAMNKKLHRFFTDDHHRLEQLLDKATEKPGEVDLHYYQQFRSGLLRHIKMEEKILFPAAKQGSEELTSRLFPRYRLEHGALTALMVPPPDATLIKVIRFVLEKHDLAEEEPGGLYDICEELTAGQTQSLLDQLEQVSEVPTHPPNPIPFAIEAARRALARANYDFDEIAGSKEPS